MSSVFMPLAALLLIGGIFILILRSRTSHAPIGLGSIYTVVVLIYGCYPLLVYILLNGYYTPFNDARLFADQPDPANVGHTAWFYCIYLASFCAGYLLWSRRTRFEGVLSISDMDAPSVWALFIIFAILRLTMLGAELTLAENTGDYVESYLKYKHLPLLAQQLLGHLDGMTAIMGLTVMAFLCRHWDRYRTIVLAWLALELALLMIGMGARTQFVVLCLAALFSYHFLYRPVSTAALATCGAVLVAAFLGLGIMRQFAGGGLTAVGLEALASTSEFETLFANAHDIERLIALGEVDKSSMFAAVLFGDVINLVPQQMMPFEKLNLANWYVDTFHSDFARQGGGFAFGAVAEALMGAGWPDLIWRGMLAGAVFAWADRAVYAKRLTVWKFALFLWLLTSCYMTFRSTMLALLPVFVYRFVPAMLSVSILAHLLRSAALPPHASLAAQTVRR